MPLRDRQFIILMKDTQMNKFCKVISLYKYILQATGTKLSFPKQPGILPIENSMIFVIHTACILLFCDRTNIWYGNMLIFN